MHGPLSYTCFNEVFMSYRSDAPNCYQFHGQTYKSLLNESS
jgi:hypothetical protein